MKFAFGSLGSLAQAGGVVCFETESAPFLYLWTVHDLTGGCQDSGLELTAATHV